MRRTEINEKNNFNYCLEACPFISNKEDITIKIGSVSCKKCNSCKEQGIEDKRDYVICDKMSGEL